MPKVLSVLVTERWVMDRIHESALPVSERGLANCGYWSIHIIPYGRKGGALARHLGCHPPNHLPANGLYSSAILILPSPIPMLLSL